LIAPREERACIDHTLPPPPYSWLDRFVGPGATRAELVLQLGAAALAAITLAGFAVALDWGWSAVQLVVASLLMLDLTGGVVTNATGAAKRWYHRPGQGRGAHLRFVAFHVQPFLLVWVLGEGEWLYATMAYGYMLAGAAVVLATPLYLRRPVAMLALVVGLLVAIYGPSAPAHCEWFLPLLLVKILVSHLLREEPSRPAPRPLPDDSETCP